MGQWLGDNFKLVEQLCKMQHSVKGHPYVTIPICGIMFQMKLKQEVIFVF